MLDRLAGWRVLSGISQQMLDSLFQLKVFVVKQLFVYEILELLKVVDVRAHCIVIGIIVYVGGG